MNINGTAFVCRGGVGGQQALWGNGIEQRMRWQDLHGNDKI